MGSIISVLYPRKMKELGRRWPHGLECFTHQNMSFPLSVYLAGNSVISCCPSWKAHKERADVIKKCLSTCCSGTGGPFEPHLQFFWSGRLQCGCMCVRGPSVSPPKQVGFPCHRYRVPLFDNPLQTSLISLSPATHSPSDSPAQEFLREHTSSGLCKFYKQRLTCVKTNVI